MKLVYLNLIDVLNVVVLTRRTLCSPANHEVTGDPDREQSSRVKRLTGGFLSEPSPIMASIQYYGQHSCGGTIYNEKLILTAAHCVEQMWYKKVTIRLGSLRSDYGGKLYNITHMVAHKNFYRQGSKYDIGLIQVHGSIEDDEYTKPIELYDWFEAVEDEMTGVSIGWGATDPVNKQISPLLNKAYLQTLSNDKCRRLKGTGIICTHFPSSDICSGDSGGPLLIFGRQAGIVSAGKCANNSISQFTAVADHRQWISGTEKALMNEHHLPYAYLKMDEVRQTEFPKWSGKRQLPHKAAWTVPILQLGGDLVCSGTVIDDYYVVTSAACVDEHEEYEIITFTRDNKQLHEVIEVVKHYGYNKLSGDRYVHDIALLQVDGIITPDQDVENLDKYEEDDEIFRGLPAELFWWESLEVEGSNRRVLGLFSMDLTTNSEEECNGIYTQSGEGSLPGNQMCASSHDGMCMALSGGSLLVTGSFAGIYTWKKSCWNYQFPSVYTEVGPYRSWINENSKLSQIPSRIRLEILSSTKRDARRSDFYM